MAKLDFSGLQDLEAMFLKEAERFDRVAPKMLEAGAKVVVEAQQQEIEAMGLVDTGSMKKSIKATKPKKDKSGWGTTVHPTGKDKKGVRNIEKAMVAEYGKKSGNPAPKPWMTVANEKCQQKANDVMRDIWESEE